MEGGAEEREEEGEEEREVGESSGGEGYEKRRGF